MLAGWGWILLVLAPGMWALAARPAAPLDELRYLAVAWEMWHRGDFLVPHLNGVPYSHKPPMLFWLIQGGWAVLGVHDWWPRLISPLAAVAGTVLTARLARELWPDGAGVARTVPWLMAGAVGWMVLSQMLLFDMPLAVCVLVAVTGVWRAARGGGTPAFAVIALGIGAGLLTKGPVILIHVLVPAVLAPAWQSGLRREARAWYWRLGLSVVGGLLLAVAWAIPAAVRGGPDYGAAILWGQTTGRVTDSFAHARPVWAYALFLPALLLPWIALPRTWRLPSRDFRRFMGTRFLVAWAGGVTLTLSLVSAKQPQYLLPVLPAFLLLMARALGTRVGAPAPWCRATAGVAVAVVLLLASGYLGFSGVLAGLDLAKPARYVGDLQAARTPMAVVGSYQGQFTFPARLTAALPTVPARETAAWAAAHPGGYLIVLDDGRPSADGVALSGRYPYRGRHLGIWRIPTAEETAP